MKMSVSISIKGDGINYSSNVSPMLAEDIIHGILAERKSLRMARNRKKANDAGGGSKCGVNAAIEN